MRNQYTRDGFMTGNIQLLDVRKEHLKDVREMFRTEPVTNFLIKQKIELIKLCISQNLDLDSFLERELPELVACGFCIAADLEQANKKRRYQRERLPVT